MSYRMPQKNTVLHEYGKIISSSLYTKGGIISCWQENILLNQRHQTAAFHGEWDWGKQFNNQQFICPDKCCVQQALKMIYSQELKENKGLKWQWKPAELLVIVIMTKWGLFLFGFSLYYEREIVISTYKHLLPCHSVQPDQASSKECTQCRSDHLNKEKLLHDLSGKRRQVIHFSAAVLAKGWQRSTRLSLPEYHYLGPA